MKDVFRKEHVGMTVYYKHMGRGIITSYSDDAKYPVAVVFEDDLSHKILLTFTADGLLNSEDSEPKLSFKPFKIYE